MQFLVISEQLLSFVHSVLLGAFFALLYDLVRVIRFFISGDENISSLKHTTFIDRIPVVSFKSTLGDNGKILLANVFDILYSLVVSVLFCIFLYAEAHGIFRLYLFIGTIIGFTVYRLSVGRFLYIPYAYAVYFIRRIIGFFLYLILLPIIKIYELMLMLLTPLYKHLKFKMLRRKTMKLSAEICKMLKF